MAIQQDRVNRPARGLLDLFRAKVGGKGPDRFSQVIQPTLDVTSYLAAHQLKVARTSTTSTSTTSITLTVPQSETWMIHAIHGEVYNSTAGTHLDSTVNQMQIVFLSTAAGTVTTLELGAYNWRGSADPAVGVTQVRQGSYTWTPGRTFLLPPGAGIRNSIVARTGSLSVNVIVTCLYTPMLV